MDKYKLLRTKDIAERLNINYTYASLIRNGKRKLTEKNEYLLNEMLNEKKEEKTMLKENNEMLKKLCNFFIK